MSGSGEHSASDGRPARRICAWCRRALSPTGYAQPTDVPEPEIDSELGDGGSVSYGICGDCLLDWRLGLPRKARGGPQGQG